jgi:recombination protein RecA
MHVVAEAQRNGGVCAYIDAEHAMDPVYARAIGVDVDQLLISQPDTGEQALEIADMLTRSGAIDVLVIDSVAALTPRAEIEGEMGDTHVGLQARLMSQALRKLTGNLHKTGTIAIFINQLREKIGVMFGSPETTPGGRALKFYASVRLDIRRIESLKDGAEVVGNRTRVKVVKNRCRRRSARPSSTSCTARASAARVRSSTCRSTSASSRSPAPGSPTRVSNSARAVRRPRSTSSRTPR